MKAVNKALNQIGCDAEKEHIDPIIYEMLIDLNMQGYPTLSSCAGHDRGTMADGQINFPGWIINGRKEGLYWLLKKYGLADITLNHEKGYRGRKTTIARFEAIGNQYSTTEFLYFEDPKEWFDYPEKLPPIPEACPTCGGHKFWIKGDIEKDEMLEWCCFECQPRAFFIDNGDSDPENPRDHHQLPEIGISADKVMV